MLAWYVIASMLGSALGSEASGRVFQTLVSSGWTEINAYHSVFWSYAIVGSINICLTLLMTEDCERTAVREQQADEEGFLDNDESHEALGLPAPDSEKDRASYKSFSRGYRLVGISSYTLDVMCKLWFLLVLDALAGGMVSYSLTNYYMEEKFEFPKSTLGDINSVAYAFGAFATMFTGPLVRRFGLLNMTIFTHAISSGAVAVFPTLESALASISLVARIGLNSLDQALRSTLLAGIVNADERTTTMGITSIVCTLAATPGPMLTGVLANGNRFWVAFMVAGTLRLAYDVGLYTIFRNPKLRRCVNGKDSEREQPEL